MLGLNEIRQTRFYQEVKQETRQETLLEERTRIVQRLTHKGNNPETIAEMLGLSIKEVTQILQFFDEN